MRRRPITAATIVCLALLAGCGDDETSTDATAADGAATSEVDSSAGSTVDTSLASTGDTVVVPTIPADCPTVDEASTDDTATEASFPDGKPDVEIPSTLPTELVVTDLIEGTGEPAKAGDIVTVNYVGVRSADGQEFDNSYDRGSTFPVTLGAGSVIAGWDQGLVGIKVGGRRQLDIPAELAYGDSPQGDVIQPGDALSFVVDAVSISAGPPVADPADAPVVDVPTSEGATEASFTDLVDGDRCDIALPGDTAYVQVILYRGDTGEELQSTWATGQAIDVELSEGTIPGLVHGVVGMGVGGRRQLILPPDQGFGADGNTEMGLDATTDIILIVDLVGIA